jgi:WXG100 family type VII secretion target
MVDYTVRPDVLDTGAADLNRVTGELQASLQRLESVAQRYMSENLGQTIENYSIAQAQWNQGLNEMRTALAQAQLDLQNINQNYITTDQRNAARMPSGQA